MTAPDDDAYVSAADGQMGLTPRMKAALDAIIGFVGMHGAMPSRRQLTGAMQRSVNSINSLMVSLTKRGALTTDPETGALMGFGSDGIAVFVPRHIAADLCVFCAERGESPVAVVTDAIVLHLDEMKGAPP